jgi:hypothetical protein
VPFTTRLRGGCLEMVQSFDPLPQWVNFIVSTYF